MQTRSQSKRVSALEAKARRDHQICEARAEALVKEIEKAREERKLSDFVTKSKGLLNDIDKAPDRISKMKIVNQLYTYLDKEILDIIPIMKIKKQSYQKFLLTIYLKARYVSTKVIDIFESSPGDHKLLFDTDIVVRRVIKKITPLID
jgi:hypothetical protein